MRSILLLLALLLMAFPAQAKLKGKLRKIYVAHAYNSCIKGEIPQGLSAKDVKTMCKCGSERWADVLGGKDVDYYNKYKKLSESTQKKLQDAVWRCAQEMLNKKYK